MFLQPDFPRCAGCARSAELNQLKNAGFSLLALQQQAGTARQTLPHLQSPHLIPFFSLPLIPQNLAQKKWWSPSELNSLTKAM